MTQMIAQTSPTRVATDVLLEVHDLQVEYKTRRGRVRAVDHVSFEIFPNEVVGLAGESGCGKSTIAHAITRLLHPPAYITGRKVNFRNTDLLGMDGETLRVFRWRHLSIVFQSVPTSRNPVLPAGNEMREC